MGSSRSLGRALRFARVVAALLVVVGPVVTDLGAVSATPAAPSAPAAPASPPSAVEEEAKQVEVAARDDAVWRAALEGWRDRTQPAVVAARTTFGVRDAVVIPASEEPYDLADVARRLPDAFEWLPGGRLLVKEPIAVAPGGHLVVDRATVASLLLTSGSKAHAFIQGMGATIAFQGQAARPLSISSFDPAAERPDDDRTDGRAFIAIRGGTMTFDQSRVSHLGYPSTGLTSGVAWTSYDGRLARGHARDATFSRNYYGAYVAGGDGLKVDHAAFVDNVLYGFDPHSSTNGTLVKRSRADRNGRHGFMFSEGCNGNVVQDSTATGNRGVGFMVDDGTMDSGLGRPSNNNTFLRDVAEGNGWAGIVVEGGTGNTVQSSRTSGQQYGIWIRNQATGTQIVNNRILGPAVAGIRLGPGLGQTDLLGNRFSGGPVGIRSDGSSATWVTGGVIVKTTDVAIRLDGDQRNARFGQLTVLAPKGHEVDLAGKRVALSELAEVQSSPPAGASAKWSLEVALHRLVFVLWALILLPTLLTRLGAKRRWQASAA